MKRTLLGNKSLILYFAGNSGNGKVGVDRENTLKQEVHARIFSFYWHGEGREFNNHFHMWREDYEMVEDGEQETNTG